MRYFQSSLGGDNTKRFIHSQSFLPTEMSLEQDIPLRKSKTPSFDNQRQLDAYPLGSQDSQPKLLLPGPKADRSPRLHFVKPDNEKAKIHQQRILYNYIIQYDTTTGGNLSRKFFFSKKDFAPFSGGLKDKGESRKVKGAGLWVLNFCDWFSLNCVSKNAEKQAEKKKPHSK